MKKLIIGSLCLLVLVACDKPEKKPEKMPETKTEQKMVQQPESKPKITSSCSLDGLGHVACTYKNTGNAKGSTCEYIALVPKEGKTPKFSRGFKKNLPAMLDYRKASKALLTYVEKELIAKKIDVVNTIVDDPELIANTMPSLWSEKMAISSDEICSGIVEAGDIRQVTALIRFVTGSSPTNMCISYEGESWSDTCSFTTIPREGIVSMLNEELKKP